MSKLDDAKKVLGVASHGLQALEAIGALAKKHLGDTGGADDKIERMTSALSTIATIVDAVRGSLDGEVDVAELEKEIQKHAERLPEDLAANDAAVMSEVDARFPKE